MATIAETLDQGLQKHRAGDLQGAAELYKTVLEAEPFHVDALHFMGIIAYQKGRSDLAVDFISRAVARNPGVADFHSNLALAYQGTGQFIEAVASCQQALQLQPDHFGAHQNLASVLAQLGRLDEATAHVREAIRLKPDFAEGHNNLGLALVEQKQLDEAAGCFREAIRLKPDYAEAYNNLGDILSQQGRFDEALENFHQALRLHPHAAKVQNNIGVALKNQGHPAEALDYLEQALKTEPSYPQAHYNRALLWLVQGNFEQGLPEYEWRQQLPEYPRRTFAQPRWDGSPLAGRTILLHAEQGMGDALQFIRYVPLVKERGGRVLVECVQPLAELLATCPGMDGIIVQGVPLPAFDVQVPLLSLPYIFQTTLATIPAQVPYLFPGDQLVERWRQELRGQGSGVRGQEESRGQWSEVRGQESGDRGQTSKEDQSAAIDHRSSLSSDPSPLTPDPFLIGIAWQGNPEQSTDRHRSLSLGHFAPLAGIGDSQLFSLQKGPGSEQIAQFAGQVPITDLGSRFTTFMDTAAALKNLDLVITVDSAMAHCAGALGVPVWVILPAVADWRWLLDREDSPWYPTMRLFRQKKLGAWDEVFERINQVKSKK